MTTPELQPIDRLRKDLRDAAGRLSVQEVRYTVDLYYQIQDFRKAAANQIRALGESGEPTNGQLSPLDKYHQIWYKPERGAAE